VARRAAKPLGAWRSDAAARWLFIWPAVLFILGLSIFPLVGSLALSFSKLVFTPGGISLAFIGTTNYQQLIFGTERTHFLGLLKDPNPIGWAFVIAVAALCGWWTVRTWRAGMRGRRLVGRVIGGLLLLAFGYYVAQALMSNGGRPGALLVTFIFVIGGIALQ